MRRLLYTALFLAGCAGSKPEEPAGPTIRITGSETLTLRLAPMLAETWRRTHPDVRFRIEANHSRDGMRALLDGEADIAASARDVISAEQEQARVNGYDLTSDASRHIVAVDVVAVVVHPNNPLDALTYDQVIGIFCNKTIDNWSFLGLDNQPIHPLAQDPASGTRALFEDFFCGPKGMHARIPVVSGTEAAKQIKEDPGAIAFVSMTEVTGKILGLRPDAYGHAMLPSQQNIIRGSYPLYHDLYLFTAGEPKGVVGDFLAWVESPAGQEVVDEARFVPLFLRPERLNEPRPLRETVHFDAGARTPSQRSLARMRMLVDELRQRAGGETRHIILEGFADDREPDAAALSQARAETVRDLLQEQLPGVYFEIIPRGADLPLAPNTTPYGRQRNRRVQIYLADEEADREVEVRSEAHPE